MYKYPFYPCIPSKSASNSSRISRLCFSTHEGNTHLYFVPAAVWKHILENTLEEVALWWKKKKEEFKKPG